MNAAHAGKELLATAALASLILVRPYEEVLSMAEQAKALPVRIPGELVERIDRLRDPDIPRERYVRRLLEKAVAAEERKAARR